MDIVSYTHTAQAATLRAHAAVRGVTLLLQDHFLRWKVLHDRVGSQSGEAGHWGQVAEHNHARAEIGLHGPTGAQELIA